MMAAALMATGVAHAETPLEQASALAVACVTARTSADLEVTATRVGAVVVDELIGRSMSVNRETTTAQEGAGAAQVAPTATDRVLRAWRSADGALLLTYTEMPIPPEMRPGLGHADGISRYCELRGRVADAGALAQSVLPLMPASATLGLQGPRQVSVVTFGAPFQFIGPALRMNFHAPLTPSMANDRERFVSAVRGWQAEVYLLNDRLEAAGS